MRKRVCAIVALTLGLAVATAGHAAGEPGRLTGGVKYDIPAWFKDSFLELADDAAEAAEADRHVMLFVHAPE